MTLCQWCDQPARYRIGDRAGPGAASACLRHLDLAGQRMADPIVTRIEQRSGFASLDERRA